MKTLQNTKLWWQAKVVQVGFQMFGSSTGPKTSTGRLISRLVEWVESENGLVTRSRRRLLTLILRTWLVNCFWTISACLIVYWRSQAKMFWRYQCLRSWSRLLRKPVYRRNVRGDWCIEGTRQPVYQEMSGLSDDGSFRTNMIHLTWLDRALYRSVGTKAALTAIVCKQLCYQSLLEATGGHAPRQLTDTKLFPRDKSSPGVKFSPWIRYGVPRIIHWFFAIVYIGYPIRRH